MGIFEHWAMAGGAGQSWCQCKKPVDVLTTYLLDRDQVMEVTDMHDTFIHITQSDLIETSDVMDEQYNSLLCTPIAEFSKSHWLLTTLVMDFATWTK